MVSEQLLNSELGPLQSEHKRARKFTALAIVGIVFTLLRARQNKDDKNKFSEVVAMLRRAGGKTVVENRK